jgi:hypothetical protein
MGEVQVNFLAIEEEAGKQVQAAKVVTPYEKDR